MCGLVPQSDQIRRSMAPQTRFGIMGCAQIARKLCRAILLAPNAALVAIGSRSGEKARQFIADNGLPESTRIHEGYETLLDDPDVDAVYMPLPTSLRVRWAVAAAEKGKHVLLEKPPALSTAELDRILEACEANDVEIMDGTMWMHHPRTAKMKALLSDPDRFGQVQRSSCLFSFCGDSEFLENNIRVKVDLDGLGALGDLGWYCIRGILWANDFDLPSTAVAFPNPIKNEAGVILSCDASLHWNDGRMATIHCSFLSHRTMDLTVIGSKGALRANDFVIPFRPDSAHFALFSGVKGWTSEPEKHDVVAEMPQEALMISEFSRLVAERKESTGGEKPERGKWPDMMRKTQLVLDAVKASIDNGSAHVQINC